ncbi:MAG: hypothetical protein A2V65_04560 [Deltaproteobacteria bacterium RBG_13_49_15]|nr:MAG: hypothetical protein A2V65_04560 [Deltaproteobacteria bacterium RBG_13_49_15]
MAPRTEIIKSKLLLAEGADTFYFFRAACEAFSVDDVQVMDFGGIKDLTTYLKALPLFPGYDKVDTIVIARDAEKNPSTAVSNVKRSLRQMDLPVPLDPFEFEGAAPRVAFVIFPGFRADAKDNTILSAGTLEDLCLEIVRDNTTFECVDQYLECLRSKGRKITRPHKTKLHSYLAGENDFVGLKIGEASRVGAWDWNHIRLTPFKDVIRAM